MKRALFQLLLAIGLSAGLVSSALAENPRVLMKTSLGEIELELNAEKAPISVENFMRYVDESFFNGLTFHRVINGFMIQGGGFTPDMDRKQGHAPIQNEAKNGLKNDRGTIAMARTNDPHSATSQFFINHRNNDNLNYPSFDGWGYAVFGKVTRGLEIVDKIADVDTKSFGRMQNVPREPILIESVTRVTN